MEFSSLNFGQNLFFVRSRKFWFDWNKLWSSTTTNSESCDLISADKSRIPSAESISQILHVPRLLEIPDFLFKEYACFWITQVDYKFWSSHLTSKARNCPGETIGWVNSWLCSEKMEVSQDLKKSGEERHGTMCSTGLPDIEHDRVE